MKNIPEINIDDYDYDLPDDRIARHPTEHRDGSKLLIYKNDTISDDRFSNVISYLPERSMLVFNDTRVIRARLLFTKDTGAAIEIFCLEPLNPSDYQQAFGATVASEWKCIIGNLKKWKTGTLKLQFKNKAVNCTLKAEKIEQKGEAWKVRFTWEPSWLSFGEVIECAGHIPLPPYLGRDDEDADYLRYQTVYAAIKGSVAAPTAGLHFTDEILGKIESGGRKTEKITLHVGAGTFKPVKSGSISLHEMHCEHYFVKLRTIENLIENTGRIIAVGTTSVRCLESLFWLGVKLIKNTGKDIEYSTGQWEYTDEKDPIIPADALGAILLHMKTEGIDQLEASTQIMILPGYTFRVVNGIITNFHQPRSSLLLLVSAWCGQGWKDIYLFALENEFRFLSYGDSSVLL